MAGSEPEVLPAAVTEAERVLVSGRRLPPTEECLPALLRSSYRIELLLGDIRDRLAKDGTVEAVEPVEAPKRRAGVR